MPTFEIVPLAELQARISPELLPMVEKFNDDLAKLRSDQGGRYTLEKADDARQIRKAFKLAAASMNRVARFPRRGEEGSVSFFLQAQAKRRGRKPKGPLEASKPGARKRGRPKQAPVPTA